MAAVKKPFLNTPKQREVMELVLAAAAAGSFIGLADLRKRLSYGPDVSSPAIQCTMRILAQHGLVERFHAGRNTFYRPTHAAYLRYR